MGDIIHQKQPKRAQGAIPAKQFAHHAPVKRNRHHIATDQTIKMSPWDHTMNASMKVDEQRVNWKGIAYMQAEYGMFDPRPRLVKR